MQLQVDCPKQKLGTADDIVARKYHQKERDWNSAGDRYNYRTIKSSASWKWKMEIPSICECYKGIP